MEWLHVQKENFNNNKKKSAWKFMCKITLKINILSERCPDLLKTKKSAEIKS